MELGAVLTSAELDGVAPTADWSRWIQAGRAANAGDGAGFATTWRDDLAQLAGLGARSVLLTAEWARLAPHPAPSPYSAEAVELLTERLEVASELGLEPWLCLVDGTLPGWFSDDDGGFLDDESRKLTWPRHIDRVGETFGHLVAGWVPQREPLLWALRRYLHASAPPGVSDVVKAAEAVRASMWADGEAWRLLAGTAPVATYQTVRMIRAAPSDSGFENVKAQQQATNTERLLWQPWLAALGEGRQIAGGLPELEVPQLRGAFDRVIVELRPPVLVDEEGRWQTQRPVPNLMIEALHQAVDELSDHEFVAAGSLAGVVDDGHSQPDHQQAMMDAAAEMTAGTKLAGWWQSSPIEGYRLDSSGPKAAPQAPASLISSDRTERSAADVFRRFQATN